MATTKAQQKAVNKYMKTNYDSLRIVVPKGQKATVQAAAEDGGKSLNSYVVTALNNNLSLDKLLSIITNEGCPIRLIDLVEKSGLSDDKLMPLIDELLGKKLVYLSGDGERSYFINLMDRQGYWHAHFRSMNDRLVFSTLKVHGNLTLSAICKKARLSELDVLHSLVTLTAQNRVLPSLGYALQQGETPPEMTFHVTWDAAKYVPLYDDDTSV